MYKIKSPAKKLGLLLIVYALILLLAVPSAMASSPASLSLNGQVVSTNVVLENGVSLLPAETLATITGVDVGQTGNVPIRQFFEARGGEVEWNAQNRQVVVIWEGNIGNEAATEEPAAPGRSADELMLRTLERSQEANTYRMQGNMSVDMNISVPGEAPERVEMGMAIDGVFQYDPLAMHMKISMDLSALLGELTPEELAELAALGIDAGAMVTETVLVNGVGYTRMPGFDQWVIDDLSGTDIMEELNDLFQLSPQQYMEMMQQFGIANVLGADAVIGGVEFYTVRNNIDSATFRNIIEEMLGDFSLESLMPVDMGLSEDELEEAQMLIEAMLQNMQANLVLVSYINKETLMTERMTMQMNINLSIPADAIPELEGPVSIAVSMNGYFNISDYGVELQLPDVSNAITQAEFLELLMGMME